MDQHFIKEKLEAKIVQFLFVKSEEQLADILTKVVSSKAVHNSLDKLSIGDIHNQLEGECWCELLQKI